MDTLAYLHLAETYEKSVNSEQENTTDSDLCYPQLNWLPEGRGAFMMFISCVFGISSLGWSNPVQALKKGEKNSQVASLQQKLQASGYFKQPVTGYFGPVTEAAIIKFQKEHGLKADGVVGSQTLAALESGSGTVTPSVVNSKPSVTKTTPKKLQPPQSQVVFQRGDLSYEVMSIQRKLQAAGYFDQPITGDFNAGTEEAVIKFQKAHRLLSNGIVDTRTLTAMESGKPQQAAVQSQAITPAVVNSSKVRSPQTSLLRRGDISAEVKFIQQQLQASGYLEQSITGSFDTATEIAVLKFQKAHGLMADGIVGPKTFAVMKSKSIKSASPTLQPAHQNSLVPEKSKQLKNLIKKQTKPSQTNNSTKFATDTNQPTNDNSLVKNQTPQLEKPNTEKTLIASASEYDLTQLVSEGFQLKASAQKDNIQKTVSSHSSKMTLKKTIAGKISPKSIVHSGNGLFFAQNMMYNHTITVYNRQYKLVKVIPDKVDLSKFGYSKFKGNYQGAPVEASFSQDGRYAWVSNYQMYGKGFKNPGSDKCNPSQKTDKSFLYRINTDSLEIDHVVQVGSVPKFVATSNDEGLVLVSNWCSWDLSVVDTAKNKEIKRIPLGPYPRGIAIDAASNKAYVAVMGSYDIAQVDLKNFSVKWLKNIGNAPRHLNIDPTGQYLYVSLNGEGKIAKIQLPQGKLIDKVSTGNAPRSMVLSDDGQRLYVVNYSDNTISKVRTNDMKVIQKIPVGANPIGVTYDPQTREVWVACYSGNIMVFQD
ncbi:peptidoglycan-binding protein [Nostoc sp. PCC 7107]|uniref:peptidoglycan-binding protein n=1 Tax=Nostoc sp. PCC 7107 TaxID=317936 RepID=UPI00029F019C|nr:peptidoglycan-binding protein [Nostoc sp. PCC 7107]AFY43823.1 40-residue YVTN family beta-propeller repeat protein [Nostoc sp. PCC 7107]